MRGVIVVYSTNRPVERETYATLLALGKAGADIIEQVGSPDVVLARNVALNLVVERLWQDSERDVVFMVDDDMIFPLELAQDLVDAARATGDPVSACYVDTRGRIAAQPYHDGKFLVGLGCLAVPAKKLLDLFKRSRKLEIHGALDMREFTWSGRSEEAIEYVTEDFRLCMRLGGARLLPLPAGHIKKRVLFPTQEGMEKFLATANRSG